MLRGLGLRLGCASMLGGCGPVVTLDGSEGSGSDGSEGSASAATVATTVTATTSPTTTSPPPTSTTIADDGTDDDVLDEGPLPWDCGAAPPGTEHHCIGVPMCDPPPMPDVLAYMSFDAGSLPMGPVPEPYVYACTIADQAQDGDLLTLELACADGPHTLELGTSVEIWFDPMGDFLLSVLPSSATFEGIDFFVTLRRAGGELVLAGGYSPWAPDHDGVPPDFLAPLDVMLLDEVCPVEPPPGGDFIEPCYSVERQALRFGLGGRAIDVYDRGVDMLSPYVMIVESAEELHDVTCTDIPGTWYAWVAVPPLPD